MAKPGQHGERLCHLVVPYVNLCLEAQRKHRSQHAIVECIVPHSSCVSGDDSASGASLKVAPVAVREHSFRMGVPLRLSPQQRRTVH